MLNEGDPYELTMGLASFSRLVHLANKWPDGLIRFSCNPSREVWATVGRGWSRPHERTLISDPALDEIVRIYVFLRPEGGRFFVSNSELYYKPEDALRCFAKLSVPNTSHVSTALRAA